MHIEGQGRGPAPASNFSRDHGVGCVIRTHAAMRFGHAQGQQTVVTHIGIVGKGKLGIAVQLRRTVRKLVSAQLVGHAHAFALFVAERIVFTANGNVVV